jgi:hypothetical protein
MPISMKPMTDNEWKERRAKMKVLKDAKAKAGIEDIDYAKLSADALNKYTTSPEFTARYKKWLEYIGPELWSKTAKADYEQILAEEAAAKQAEAKKQPVDGK